MTLHAAYRAAYRRARALQVSRSLHVLDPRSVVRGRRRDHVTDPAEKAARADPHAGRDDQPENAPQEVAVVELPDSRNDRAENRGQTWTLHLAHALRSPALGSAVI